jgi:hypothetical protein
MSIGGSAVPAPISFEQWRGCLLMRFKGLDLNLLVALDALIETRSVSRSVSGWA